MWTVTHSDTCIGFVPGAFGKACSQELTAEPYRLRLGLDYSFKYIYIYIDKIVDFKVNIIGRAYVITQGEQESGNKPPHSVVPQSC